MILIFILYVSQLIICFTISKCMTYLILVCFLHYYIAHRSKPDSSAYDNYIGCVDNQFNTTVCIATSLKHLLVCYKLRVHQLCNMPQRLLVH